MHWENLLRIKVDKADDGGEATNNYLNFIHKFGLFNFVYPKFLLLKFGYPKV